MSDEAHEGEISLSPVQKSLYTERQGIQYLGGVPASIFRFRPEYAGFGMPFRGASDRMLIMHASKRAVGFTLGSWDNFPKHDSDYYFDAQYTPEGDLDLSAKLIKIVDGKPVRHPDLSLTTLIAGALLFAQSTGVEIKRVPVSMGAIFSGMENTNLIVFREEFNRNIQSGMDRDEAIRKAIMNMPSGKALSRNGFTEFTDLHIDQEIFEDTPLKQLSNMELEINKGIDVVFTKPSPEIPSK